MYRTLCILALSLLMLIQISGCDDDWFPGPSPINCSLNPDGSGFILRDNRLDLSYWGKPYYVSDELVFQLGSKIFRRSLDSPQPIQLFPDNLSITDKENMVIDREHQKLYFAANSAIYTVSFSGVGLTKLSPDSLNVLSAPALSSAGNYLTAIRNGAVYRLDLLSGQWLKAQNITAAWQAVYIEATDEYYYVQKSGTSSLRRLCSGAIQPEILGSLSVGNGFTRWAVSPDFRYLGMMIGNSYDLPTAGTNLMIYDRTTGVRTDLEQCFAFAFSDLSSKVLYSHLVRGMADVNLLDLETGTNDLLWDGYFTQTSYSYSVNELYWRSDGGHIFINGQQGYRNNNKGSGGFGLGRMVMPNER